MNLHFDLSGPFDPRKPTRSARRVQTRKIAEDAEAERRRHVAQFVDKMNSLTPEERRKAAQLHDDYCLLKERAAKFASVPEAERMTIILFDPTFRLVAYTEGDILGESYQLYAVNDALDPC